LTLNPGWKSPHGAFFWNDPIFGNYCAVASQRWWPPRTRKADMLNVSATQELAWKLETQSSEVAARSQQLAQMVKQAKLATLPAAPARTGGGVPGTGTLATASLGN
jgi:hypothetical protein